jgi:kanamycin kinase
MLHESRTARCPVPDRMKDYFDTVEENYAKGAYDLSFGSFSSAEDAYRAATEGRSLLKSDTLIHGDYCLPNILFNNWCFSGFIDLGNGGVGDRHVDLFWGAWTLAYNLKTDAYRDRFFDAYGRDRTDPDALLVVSAAEIFG